LNHDNLNFRVSELVTSNKSYSPDVGGKSIFLMVAIGLQSVKQE
jgi:hypothetical protein